MDIKTTLICTVLNEEDTIGNFLDSILIQVRKPDEIVIVDGGSIDNTFDILKGFQGNHKELNIRVYRKRGNRSVGRNFAIEQSKNPIILSSDAGCILDKNWVKNISSKFNNRKTEVVAGYYKGLSSNAFQEALVPYVLIMEDKVKPLEFLPATRSMAFKKNIWEKIGKFDEELSNNEDYEFARRIKEVGKNITFAKDAIVYWIPRKNISEAFKMFYRFSLGDAESGILRPKVLLIFTRYIFGFLLILVSIKLAILLVLIYISWSILKNARYLKRTTGIFYLAILQFASDFAVLFGTVQGLIIRLVK